MLVLVLHAKFYQSRDVHRFNATGIVAELPRLAIGGLGQLRERDIGEVQSSGSLEASFAARQRFTARSLT